MKFAIWDKIAPRRGISHHELYSQHMREVVHAEKCGFDHFWFFEHHVSPNAPIPSPNILIAAAAVLTSRIRLGNMVNVLPYRNPLILAEEVAMLDVLSNGRIDVGVGRGLKPTEFEAFCLSQADSREMFEESIGVMQKVWADETFRHEGKHFKVDKKTKLSPPIVQRPTPPLWVSAQSAESLRWTAERDYMFGQIDSLIDDCQKDCATYRNIQVESGHAPTNRLFLSREVYVAETDAQAREECYEYMLEEWDLWNRYSQFARNGKLPPSYAIWAKRAPMLSSLSFEQLIEKGVILVGSPKTVIDSIQWHREKLDLAVLVCAMQLGAMPSEMAMKSMQLFSEKVMPAVRGTSSERSIVSTGDAAHV